MPLTACLRPSRCSPEANTTISSHNPVVKSANYGSHEGDIPQVATLQEQTY